jgi:hypothetical protein
MGTDIGVNDSDFVQEYLYIEDYYDDILDKDYKEKLKGKDKDEERGVIVIDIFGD